MRLHRFYISVPILGDSFDILDGGLVHQWKKVFRYNVGSQVILFDGLGTDFLCIITRLATAGATVSILKKTKAQSLVKRGVWLCPSLIKKDNFDLVVQKATELGVSTIIPILSTHSEKKKINLERLKKISIESSEQSGRVNIPTIHDVITLKSIFDSGILPQQKIALDPAGTLFHNYADTMPAGSVAVFVGPEGGFEKSEIEFFRSFNVPILSLGDQILRAETASIASASLLLL